jgi:hypothetical protein
VQAGKGESNMQDTGEIFCRSYRFGHVSVDVFAELVTIAIPYGNPNHDDFVDASIFIERYTHGADALVLEDDELGLELRAYPNTENLISTERPCQLPPPDPRLGYWDEPRRRPEGGELVRPGESLSGFVRLYNVAAWTEQYVQEVVLRAGAAGVTLVQAVVSH